jgi:NAD(P)-dependent dehydrogenase (short-subunit alcohol dehydrogenase family)
LDLAETKTAFVTGATSGIGIWTVLGLVRAGVRVIAAGRDPGRARALQDFVARRAGGARVEVVLGDLSRLGEVLRLAEQVRATAPRLDLLVNNAGLLAKRRIVTEEGNELILAVNHLAPFLLMRELQDALPQGGRIVNVGSAASDRATIRLDDLQCARGWTTMRAYGQAKLALMLCSFALARRLEPRGVAVNVVHPGVVGTRIGDLGGAFGFAWSLLKPFLLSEEEGAATTLHVALSAEAEGVSGRFWKKGRPTAPNALALDARLAERVWAETERIAERSIGRRLPSLHPSS